jgi:pimeloyl-ACP methyl ester carboxylesterase
VNVTAFVLVHGAWHGSWCWDLLAAELRAKGNAVVAPDLPCDDPAAGLADYVAAVRSAMGGGVGNDPADTVLVGHSMGGLTIPLLADQARRLVFLAAMIPEPGLSTQFTIRRDAEFELKVLDSPAGFRLVKNPDGTTSVDPTAARDAFYHDVDEPSAQWAVSQLRSQGAPPSLEACPLTAWPTTPCSYIVCADDRMVSPAWQRDVARRLLGVEPIELAGSHSPFLARPAELAALLETQ